MKYLFNIDCDNTLIPFHMHKLLTMLSDPFLKRILSSELEGSDKENVEQHVDDVQAAIEDIRKGVNDEAANRVLDFIDWAVSDEQLRTKFEAMFSFSSSKTRASYAPFLTEGQPIREVIATNGEAFCEFFRMATANGHQVSIVTNTLFPGIVPVILASKGLSAEEIAATTLVAGQVDYVDGSELPQVRLQPTCSESLMLSAGKQLHMLQAERQLNGVGTSRDSGSYVLIDDDTDNLRVAKIAGCRIIHLPGCTDYAASVFSSSELMMLAQHQNAVIDVKEASAAQPLSIEGYRRPKVAPMKFFGVRAPRPRMTPLQIVNLFLAEKVDDVDVKKALQGLVTQAFKQQDRQSWQAVIEHMQTFTSFDLSALLKQDVIRRNDITGARVSFAMRQTVVTELTKVAKLFNEEASLSQSASL